MEAETKMSVLIAKDIHKRAKVFAAEHDIALKDLVAQALEAFMLRKTSATKREAAA